MKNSIKCVVALLITGSVINGSTAQTTSLTTAERQEIINQVKQAVLDSLHNDNNPQKETFKHLTVSGYLETYYSYDFANPSNHVRQPFVYSFNRHNEVNLNFGVIKTSYDNKKIRANLGLMAGTYSNDNLAAEPGVIKNVFEANAGFKLSKTKQLWLDAGIFSSHIGFESAIGKDCWNLTRSLMADNSPYYETGVKISYTSDNEKWFVSGLILNGWQRVYRPDGNNTPAFGHQLTWKPNEKLTLNSSSFIGSDAPDSIRVMRYFHNLYGMFQFNDYIGLTLGFDIGIQQNSKGSNQYNPWYSPVAILRISPSEKTAIGIRGEYYSDAKGTIIATGTPNGFQTWGYSINFDYNINKYFIWRIEGRGFTSKDQIFMLNNAPSNHNFFVTTSLAVSF